MRKESVYEIVSRDERFTILSRLLDSSGIGDVVAGEKEIFTVFAPTNDAFQSLSESALELLTSPEGRALAVAILRQHLIPKSYLYADDLRGQDSVKTMHGNKLKITEAANVLQLEGAHILTPGIAASNGVVFPIDKVLPAKGETVLARKTP